MALNPKNLTKRAVVGTTYSLIFVAATLFSWQTTMFFIVATAAICCFEFLRMAKQAGHRPYMTNATVSAAIIPLACSVNVVTEHHLVPAMVVAFVAACIMLLRFFAAEEDSIVDVTLSMFGFLYTGLALVSFILIRKSFDGLEGGLFASMILCTIWANDACAYLGGSAFGKHKFSPKISPKKTWEGVAFGMAGTIAVWLLIPVICPNCGFTWWYAALCGLLCGTLGIIGDLTESHIKREFGVKDSGTLLPGHGGLLDRSDSLIFVSVGAYALLLAAPYVQQIVELLL